MSSKHQNSSFRFPFSIKTQLEIIYLEIATADGVLTDNPHLVLLFYMAQLFLRELVKSYRLIQVVPMDMSGYYDTNNGTVHEGRLSHCVTFAGEKNDDNQRKQAWLGD
uniref:Uncharacterized protein n=1 Tax=Glossina austeni TaxID=7395 RepID=A0A1A9VW52_GLOAU